jgi:hypothetical protein
MPLQCFIIGNGMGVGIQGAVFRYQITPQGNSLIPITTEISYVTSGLYEGKSAFSVICWVIGTVILTVMAIFSLVHWSRLSFQQIRIIILGVTAAGISYLASCGFQYGVFLSGPAGRSLPVGVILMIVFSIFLYYYRDIIGYHDEKIH